MRAFLRGLFRRNRRHSRADNDEKPKRVPVPVSALGPISHDALLCAPSPRIRVQRHVLTTSDPSSKARQRSRSLSLNGRTGNVKKWCNDVYKPGGYGTGPLTDPTGLLEDASDLTIDALEQFRVARSGDYLMPAYQSKHNWHVKFPDAGFGANGGFRLVRTLVPRR